MEKIKITKEEEPRHCNACSNTNYKKLFSTDNPVAIYEVECGCSCVTLCEDCLKALANKINTETNKE